MRILKTVLLFTLLTAITCCKGQTQTGQTGEKGRAKTGLPGSGPLISDTAYGQIIKCSLRDRSGNLWFGTTWKGVFRYDGRTFTHFSENEGLCSNTVNVLYEDDKGLLWLGTDKGVCCFDGKRFTGFPLQAAHDEALFSGLHTQHAASQMVESIIQDRAGNMWFGIWGGAGAAGAYRYDGKTLAHLLPESPVQGIAEDREGGIWLNSKRFDGTSFTDFSKQKDMFAEGVVCSLTDKAGNVWFGVRSNGLYRYDGKAFTFFSARDGLFDNRVGCIMQDKAGALWLGCDISLSRGKGGVCRYDGKTFTHFPQTGDIGMYSVLTAVEDNNGNIWLGGRGGKLCRYDGKTFTDVSAALK